MCGVAIVVLIVIIVRIIGFGAHAAKQNAAINEVYTLILRYVKATHEWPHSWAELARVSTSSDRFALPRSQGELERFVIIDFGVDMETLAAQSKDTFSGFRTKGSPVYDYSQYYDEIIKLVRKTRGALSQTAPMNDPP